MQGGRCAFLHLQGPAPVGRHLLEGELHLGLQHEILEVSGGDEVVDMEEFTRMSAPGSLTLSSRQWSTIQLLYRQP